MDTTELALSADTDPQGVTPESGPGVFRAAPTAIVVDVTNSCNLRCPVCPVTIAMTRKRGMMSMEVFAQIIDGFRDRPEKPEIFFNFSGEPTLNPLLPAFIRLATDQGHKTFVSTNATRLSEQMSRAIIGAGLGRIYLCMDGFDKEAQESYRVRSRFEQVKANIERFVRLRDELRPGRPLCVLQTLLTRYSEGQQDAIVAWARAIGIDRVRFKSFSTGSYTTPEEKVLADRFLPTDPAYRRSSDAPPPRSCGEPLHSPVVFWDGSLGLCCIDYDRRVRMPSIMTSGFMDAYLSDEAVAARAAGYRKQHAICQGCAYNSAEFRGFKIDLKPPTGDDPAA
jgi:MoaA/NifB/PqqE/SkfB family radical SAM enzyme